MRWSSADLIAKGLNPDGTRRKREPASKHKPVDREGKLHEQILEYCQRKGWPRVHARMDVPATSEIGTPDFVIAMPGPRTLWVECKAGKNKPSPAQLAWLAMLKAVGHEAYVIHSFEEFLEIVDNEGHTRVQPA